MLDGIDHFIKERLRVKHYARYMDDMVLIGNDHKQMRRWLADITVELKKIGFDVHPKKTKIVPLRIGFMWLGYQYRLTGSGKVVMMLDPDRVNAARRKYYRMVKKAKNGEISREKVDESYWCWRNHAGKGDGRRMIYNMDLYYAGLWEDKTDDQDC